MKTLAIVLAFHLLIVHDKQNTFPCPIQSLHVYILFIDNIFFVSRFHCLRSELSLRVSPTLHRMHTCVWEISWPFRNRRPASDRAVIAIFQCSEIKRKRAVFECFVVLVRTVHAIKQRAPRGSPPDLPHTIFSGCDGIPIEQDQAVRFNSLAFLKGENILLTGWRIFTGHVGVRSGEERNQTLCQRNVHLQHHFVAGDM